MPTFKSFGDLGAYREQLKKDTDVAHTNTQKKKEEERRLKFEQFLSGKFNNFLPGNFATILEGVDSVSITKPKPDPSTGEIKNLYVMPFWKHNDKERSETFTLTKTGEIIGRMPAEWGIMREQLLDEVLRIVENMDLDFFEPVDDALFPKRDKKEKDLIPVSDGKGKIPGPKPIDPRRINFFKNQPGSLFGIAGINSGFRGYYVFVFNRFIILDNEEVGNAVYFFNLNQEIKLPENVFKLPPAKRLDHNQRQAIIEEIWKPIANQFETKLGAQRAGAERVIHPDTTDERWEEKMVKEIKKRSMNV